MKKLYSLLFFFSMGFFYGNAQKLELPESATYHLPTKSFYISNVKSKNIIRQNAKGTQTVFANIDAQCLGLTIYKNTLYVVADDQIMGFDITSKKSVFSITIDDAKQLNDISTDETGTLYVSDKAGNNIYKINTKEKKYSKLLKPNSIKAPNGLYYDKTSKVLLVCNTTENSSIFTVDLKDGEVISQFATNYTNFDGLAVDNLGNMYVTSWSKDWKKSKLLQFGKMSKQPKVLLSNSKGMSDLDYSPALNKLIMVNSFEGTIKAENPKLIK